MPPDTLGLLWGAEVGFRASGKCLDPRGPETDVLSLLPQGRQSHPGRPEPCADHARPAPVPTKTIPWNLVKLDTGGSFEGEKSLRDGLKLEGVSEGWWRGEEAISVDCEVGSWVVRENVSSTVGGREVDDKGAPLPNA